MRFDQAKTYLRIKEENEAQTVRHSKLMIVLAKQIVPRCIPTLLQTRNARDAEYRGKGL